MLLSDRYYAYQKPDKITSLDRVFADTVHSDQQITFLGIHTVRDCVRSAPAMECSPVVFARCLLLAWWFTGLGQHNLETNQWGATDVFLDPSACLIF